MFLHKELLKSAQTVAGLKKPYSFSDCCYCSLLKRYPHLDKNKEHLNNCRIKK